MIWSIMPEEIIFGVQDDDIQPAGELKQVSYLGREVVVQPQKGGKAMIVQLLSADPRDFLDVRFNPGGIVDIT